MRIAVALSLFAMACSGSNLPPKFPEQPGHFYANETPLDGVKYCASTVTQWEIHRCVHELTQEEQSRRSYSQRLTFKNGRLVEFAIVNGTGSLVDDNRIARLVYSYEKDHPIRTVGEDRTGIVRSKSRVSSDFTVVRWLDAFDRPKPQDQSSASGLRRTLDAKGRVTSYTYIDASEAPTLSRSKVYQVKAVRNDAGALVEASYFDDSGERMLDEQHVHRIEYEVDDTGLEIGRKFFGLDGQAVESKDGPHETRMELDDVGNPIVWSFWDTKGARTQSKREGAAGYSVRRDEHGSEYERTYFDERAHPTVSAHGYATRRKQLNPEGIPYSWAFFDESGTAAPLPDSEHAITRAKLDAKGRVVENRFYDVNARPTLHAEGYHLEIFEYDARGNVERVSYFGVDKEPVAISGGYAKKSYSYDGDRLHTLMYQNADGSLVESSHGYATLMLTYDSNGATAQRLRFDAQSNLFPDDLPRPGKPP